MDKIWDRKSFEVGGHWPVWWIKNRMITQNRQKSNAELFKKNLTSCFVTSKKGETPLVTKWVNTHTKPQATS